jgi:glycosyltransferase involved in cell wall biosynthesis
MLKILVIHSGQLDKGDMADATDIWRIQRPFEELGKHVDWEITERDQLYDPEKFDEKDPKALDRLGDSLRKYDLTWVNYRLHPLAFGLLHTLHSLYGLKFVIDCDDDVYNFQPDESFTLNTDDLSVMQIIVEDAPYLVTTTEKLKAFYESKRLAPTYVMPNFINEKFIWDRKPNKHLTIGYFGGYKHYKDLHHSGFEWAIEKIMHEFKDVRFVTCGQYFDNYLPKARYTQVPVAGGHEWINKLKELNFDIAVCPLIDVQFNRVKSNIKLLESAAMGAAVVASNIGPYEDAPNVLLVKNTPTEWYDGLKKLVTDTKLRTKLAQDSKAALQDYMIEKNWKELESIILDICDIM